jgi:hypothetical protein
MPPSSEQVTAARALLSEVCALLFKHRDDAVLVGGWVPEVLFPEARPAHVGSIDVDVALRLQRDGYARLVAILGERGFHQGEHGYQFFKEIPLPNGRTCLARLDLLTSQRHYDTHFAGTRPDQAPEPIRGADVAFADNALVPVGDHATLRVAGIVAFLVMKSLAMHGRTNEKDAYDTRGIELQLCSRLSRSDHPDSIQNLFRVICQIARHNRLVRCNKSALYENQVIKVRTVCNDADGTHQHLAAQRLEEGGNRCSL